MKKMLFIKTGLVIFLLTIASTSQAKILQFHGKSKFLAYGGGQTASCVFNAPTTDQFGFTYDDFHKGMCYGATAGFQFGDFNGGFAIEAEYNMASGNGLTASGIGYTLRNRTYDGFARGQNGFEGMYWHGAIGTDGVAQSFWGGAGAGYKTRSNLMFEAEARYTLIDAFDTVSPYSFRAKLMYGLNLP